MDDLTTKSIAKAYSTAIELDAVDLNEIIQWSDSLILQLDVPSDSLIELSLCKKASDARKYLNVIAEGADITLFQKYLFGMAFKALANNRSNYSEVSKFIHFLALDNEELELFGDVFYYWDAIDLAESGIHGYLPAIRNEFLNFLKSNMLEIPSKDGTINKMET